jgi:hypothetical protein
MRCGTATPECGEAFREFREFGEFGEFGDDPEQYQPALGGMPRLAQTILKFLQVDEHTTSILPVF